MTLDQGVPFGCHLGSGVPLVIGVSSVRAGSTSGLLLSIFLDPGLWHIVEAQ